MDHSLDPLSKQGYECRQLNVQAGKRKLTPVIVSPPEDKLSEAPVLLVMLGTEPKVNLLERPFCIPVEIFLQKGHRVVSLAMLGKDSVVPIRNAVAHAIENKGGDPFDVFVKEIGVLLDYCIEHRWASPGRIVVAGTSRYAYSALRLLADDARVVAGAGYAPVTDWRDLSEFGDICDRKEVADLRLSRFAAQLAGKHVFLAIGNHDERVNTRSCCQLFLDLDAANRLRGDEGTLVDFYCTADPDHTCADESYVRGSAFLLKGY